MFLHSSNSFQSHSWDSKYSDREPQRAIIYRLNERYRLADELTIIRPRVVLVGTAPIEEKVGVTLVIFFVKKNAD